MSPAILSSTVSQVISFSNTLLTLSYLLRIRKQRKTLKMPVNPKTQVNELHNLCQIILDSLLFCRGKLMLKPNKVDDILDLLLLCKRALIQLLNQAETTQLISDLAKLRKTTDEKRS